MIEKTDHDLLIRIDERTESMAEHLKTINGKLQEHDEELHKEGGLCERMTSTETKQRTNRTLIYTLWSIIVLVVTALFTFFFQHIDATKDKVSALFTLIRHLI